MRHLITHGDREFGPNPGHTAKGFAQISAIPIPNGISKFVVGTGNRFQQVLWTLRQDYPYLQDVPFEYSPFCGSADGLDPPNTIVLANGIECPMAEYIGLTSPFFNAWGFIGSQPEGTLFCAGGELLIALGLGDINQKGHLYELGLVARTGKMTA